MASVQGIYIQLLFVVTGFYCISHQNFTVAWLRCSTVREGDCGDKESKSDLQSNESREGFLITLTCIYLHICMFVAA